MRRLAAAVGIALFLLLAGAIGYDAYRKSSHALLIRARTAAMMPSCPGAQANWLRERGSGVDVTQWVEIHADAGCLAAWAVTLGRPRSGFDCAMRAGHAHCSNLGQRDPIRIAWGASVEFLPDRAQLTLWS